MKNLYLYTILLFSGFVVHSQNRSNHWLLGLTYINFTNNLLTANTVTGGAISKYGTATVSDSNGNLLFYTNGKTVWNKNHQVMQNGLEIGQDTGSLQEVIIVPHPGNSKSYYIFRQEVISGAGGNPDNYGYATGYYIYSVVDFSVNTLGRVEAINILPSQSRGEINTYTKALENPYVEMSHSKFYSPLTFTADSTGNNYWLIVQKDNSMYSYKIDSSGLSNLPVVSTFPPNQIYNIGPIDQAGRYVGIQRSMFRVTPVVNNSKLYGLESSPQYNTSDDPAWHGYKFYSLDFNNATGQFSNFQPITVEGNGGVSYTFELSPDLLKSYFITYQKPYGNVSTNGQIIVKDLTSLNTPARLLYEYANTTKASFQFGNIQKDKYGNVWVSANSEDVNKTKYLHLINNPNSFSNSKVEINKLYLNNNSINVMPQLFPRLTCIEDLYLNHTETSNKTYKASNLISTNTSYIVNSGVTVNLKAQNVVYLEANTDIKNGAILIAEIEECGGGSTGRISVDTDEITDSIFLGEKLLIYPNPSDTRVTFSLSNEKIKNIIIYSLDGRVVFTTQVMNNAYEADITNYPRGVYLVKINTDQNNVFTEKFIKN